jgi:lysine/ornithine N-monooxygenase
LDQFLCSSSICPTRREFEDYFGWVAKQITDVIFATNVTSVEYEPETNLFIVEAEHGSRSQTRYKSKHIVLGNGPQPNSTIASSGGGHVVDVSALLTFNFPNPSPRVLVIGGGQSAAECINYLLDRYANVEMHITWVTRETAFRALDKGNFSREVYSASYGHAFAPLPRQLREKIMRDDRNVANGITPEIAQALYQRLYCLKYLSSSGGASVHMQSNTEVLEIRDEANGALVTALALATGQTNTAVYDCAILCTGFDDKYILESPIIGGELRRRINNNEAPDGYAIAWDGPPTE